MEFGNVVGKMYLCIVIDDGGNYGEGISTDGGSFAEHHMREELSQEDQEEGFFEIINGTSFLLEHRLSGFAQLKDKMKSYREQGDKMTESYGTFTEIISGVYFCKLHKVKLLRLLWVDGDGIFRGIFHGNFTE